MQMNDSLVEQLAADLPSDALSKGRAVVLGLDGVPHSMLTELMAHGVMPNMARLVATGPLRQIVPTLPSISAASLSPVHPNICPGLHGIPRFTDRRPRTYKPDNPPICHTLVSTSDEFAENLVMQPFVLGL